MSFKKSVVLPIILFFLMFASVSASSLGSLSINTNTVYQNTNTTSPLYIYAITNGGYASGYIGSTSGNLIYVLNSTIVLSGVIGAVLSYKVPMTLIVPPGWYYKFNYSSSEQFQGMYSSVIGSVGSYTFNSPLEVENGNQVSVAVGPGLGIIGENVVNLNTSAAGLTFVSPLSRSGNTISFPYNGEQFFISGNQFNANDIEIAPLSYIFTNGLQLASGNVVSVMTNSPIYVSPNGISLNYKMPLYVNNANSLSVNNSSSSTGSFILLSSIGINRYSNSAILIFCIGLMLFVVLLLNILGQINLWRGTFIGGLANMVLGFGVVILLVFSGFYTETITSPVYTITARMQITTVAATSISTLPLASIPLLFAIIVLFSIVSAILGGIGLFFIIFLVEGNRKARKSQKYG